MDQLEGDGTRQGGLGRLVDGPHAAGGEQPACEVRPDACREQARERGVGRGRVVVRNLRLMEEAIGLVRGESDRSDLPRSGC